MVYIYKKTIGDKEYYYLRVSKRVDGKITIKDVAYLGNSIEEVKKSLEGLKKFQTEIRKSYRNISRSLQSGHFLELARKSKLKSDNYLEKDVAEQVEAAKLHFKNHFLKSDPATIRETLKHFTIEFAFNSTSIEGNTITLQEAKRLLTDQILPANRTLREVYDLQNTEKTFFWLIDEKPAFDEQLIIKVHDLLLDNIDIRKGYRNHDIHVFKSRFDATPFTYIRADMKLLMKFYNENQQKMHPLVLALTIHHKLEKIHPFADGNGRTGRMMMNYILIMKGYPPIVVSKKKRADYLESLRQADVSELTKAESKSYKKLVNYMAEELLESYWTNFNI
ncbi:MAG: Fic family protein [Candidatus Woesearchaeota archaeon]